MGEIVRMEPAGAPVPVERQLADMRSALEAMAAMLAATTAAMEDMRTQIRRLEKVTPGQAAAVNAAIRSRAGELCRMYGADGGERAAANSIRRDVRNQFGCTGARDLAQCDYAVAVEMIGLWDDYKAMTAIRRARQ